MHTQKTLNSFFTAAGIYTDTTALNSGRLVYFTLFLSLFANVCGDLWPYFSRGSVVFIVICFCWVYTEGVVSDVDVFLAVSCFYCFLKRETAKSETVSHMITTALFRVRPHLYDEDGLTNCLSDFQKTF